MVLGKVPRVLCQCLEGTLSRLSLKSSTRRWRRIRRICPQLLDHDLSHSDLFMQSFSVSLQGRHPCIQSRDPVVELLVLLLSKKLTRSVVVIKSSEQVGSVGSALGAIHGAPARVLCERLRNPMIIFCFCICFTIICWRPLFDHFSTAALRLPGNLSRVPRESAIVRKKKRVVEQRFPIGEHFGGQNKS